MSKHVYMTVGHWALAFDQPYFAPGSDMREMLERFTKWGGGWTGHKASEIFVVHQVQKVMPNTYIAKDWRRNAGPDDVCRYPRENVILMAFWEEQAIAVRDRFHAIGVKVTEDIENEAERLIQPYAAKRKAKALHEIHECLPSIFGRNL